MFNPSQVKSKKNDPLENTISEDCHKKTNEYFMFFSNQNNLKLNAYEKQWISSLTLSPDRDLFLKNHIVEGEYATVANVVFEILAQAALAHGRILRSGPFRVIGLESLKLKRILRVPFNETKTFEIESNVIEDTSNPSGDICFFIRISARVLKEGGDILRKYIHAEGRVRLSFKSNWPQKKTLSEDFKNGYRKYRVSKYDAYEVLHRNRGPIFQKLTDEFFVSEDDRSINGWAEISDLDGCPFSSADGSLVTYPDLGECSLQLQALQTRIKDKNVKIPVSVEKIDLFPEPKVGGIYSIKVVEQYGNEEINSCNIEIKNKQGEIIVRYTGCVFQKKYTKYDQCSFESLLTRSLL